MKDSTELKAYGLRVTVPRVQILEIFQDSSVRHLTADDVYRQLIKQGSEIGLATVYRVLLQLQRAGLLKQVHIEPERALYELNDGLHHDHLVCTLCGRVHEFRDAGIEQRQKTIAKALGFEVMEHVHVLYGRCRNPDCEHRPTLTSSNFTRNKNEY
ncbi:MAG: ferric iron uptake transcriptional regulator [Paenalcaligenes sp.]